MRIRMPTSRIDVAGFVKSAIFPVDFMKSAILKIRRNTHTRLYTQGVIGMFDIFNNYSVFLTYFFYIISTLLCYNH